MFSIPFLIEINLRFFQGIFDIPLDVFARAAYWAVTEFVSKVTTDTSLREVHLVNNDAGTTGVIQINFQQLGASEKIAAEDGETTSDQGLSSSRQRKSPTYGTVGVPASEVSAARHNVSGVADPQTGNKWSTDGRRGSGGDTADTIQAYSIQNRKFYSMPWRGAFDGRAASSMTGSCGVSSPDKEFSSYPPDATASGRRRHDNPPDNSDCRCDAKGNPNSDSEP